MSAPRTVYYAAMLRRGPAWQVGDMTKQALWPRHAAFMNKLAENGTILFGGPLDEGEQVLLVLAVPDEASVRTVLAPDPWNAAGLLEIVSVRQWSVLLEHQRDLAKI